MAWDGQYAYEKGDVLTLSLARVFQSRFSCQFGGEEFFLICSPTKLDASIHQFLDFVSSICLVFLREVCPIFVLADVRRFFPAVQLTAHCRLSFRVL
jgi:hypothetical protein